MLILQSVLLSLLWRITMVRTSTESKNVDVWEKKKQAKNVDEGDPKEDLVQLEILKATGVEVKFLSKDFGKLCGRPAETFDEYLDAKSEIVTPPEHLI
jgi:hypothetical protein